MRAHARAAPFAESDARPVALQPSRVLVHGGHLPWASLRRVESIEGVGDTRLYLSLSSTARAAGCSARRVAALGNGTAGRAHFALWIGLVVRAARCSS